MIARFQARVTYAMSGGFLFACLWGCGSDTASPQPGSPAPSEAAIQRAYTMKCSLCHGTDGKLMASKSPDLSSSTLSLEERVAIISYGKGTMPPQKDVLDAATIRGIATYIERFRTDD